MTGTNDKLRSLFLATLMVFSVFGATVAFTGTAAAANSATVSASPNGAGDISTHEINATVESNDDSTSLNDIEIDYSVGADPADVSSVQQSDVTVVYQGTDISSDISGVSASNNGEQLDISLGGSTTINQGEQVNVSVDDVTNPNTAGNYNVEVALNSGSTDNPATATLSISSPTFTVSDLDAPRVAPNNTEITVSANITNDGAVTDTQSVSYFANDGGANVTAGTSSQSVTLDAGESQIVSFTVNTSDLPGTGVPREFTHGVTTTSDTDGESAPLTVGTDSNGQINIEVIDQNSNPVTDTNVALYTPAEWGSVNPVPFEVQGTDSQGFALFDELAVGPGPDQAGAIDYIAQAGYDDVNFTSRNTELNLYETQQRADDATLRLERVIDPVEINVSPSTDDALADGTDTVEYTATVIGEDGEPYQGAEVDIFDNAEAGTLDYIPNQPYTSNASGQFTVEVSSTATQVVDFEFNVSGENGVDTNVTGRFTTVGEGSLYGSVVSEATTEGIEDASVWVVDQDDYSENTETTTIDVDFYDDDDTVYIRLVDNETNSIIDANDYDIRVTDDGRTGVSDTTDAVSKLDLLNETDLAEGSGYALIDQDDDGLVTINHTRIEPREYYVQASLDAENASDFDDDADNIVDDDEGVENFVNVTGLNPTTLDGQDTDDVTALGGVIDSTDVYSPSTNLTVEATAQLAEESDSNFVDAPGVVNTFGDDTAGTNEDGDYVLSEIPTDFQNGVGYVAIASHPRHSTDFADVVLSEDGNLEFAEGQGSTDFFLEPVPVQPEVVNITNLGLYENESVLGNDAFFHEFEDKSDDYNQSVPRDGAVDVIKVETLTEEGALENGTVELTVPDDDGLLVPYLDGRNNFTGTFIGVDDGEVVSGLNSETITVRTGENGQATVYLEADRSGEDFERYNVNRTGIQAVLQEDTAATDFSNKSFVGVINWATNGSINAPITNESNQGIPNSVVYTTEFYDGAGNTVTIEPVSGNLEVDSREEALNAEFNVYFEDEVATVEGRDLASSSDGGTGGFDIDGTFAEISTVGGQNVTLLTFPAEGAQGSVEYTLPRVPAVSPDGIQYSLRGVQFETGEVGNGESANPVEPGVTQAGNIVITGAAPLDDPEPPENELEQYENSGGVVDDDGLQNAIGDWSTGGLSDEDFQVVISAWATESGV